MIRIVLAFLSVTVLAGCAAVLVGGAATSAVVLHDRRLSKTVLEDKGIEVQAHTIIAELKQKEPSIRVVPIAYNHQLLILGQVPNAYTRHHVVDSLRAIAHVRKVYDELSLGAPLPLPRRNSDTWITARIKKEMLLSKMVDPTRLKVVTEDSVVYLLGIAHPAEIKEAVELARNVQGVERVVKIFDTFKE